MNHSASSVANSCEIDDFGRDLSIDESGRVGLLRHCLGPTQAEKNDLQQHKRSKY